MNDATGSNSPVDKQLVGLSNLLLLQARARSAKNTEELGFLLVNDTRLLVPYQSAIFWIKEPGQSARQGSIVSASDVPEIDSKSPFSVWINSVAKTLVKSEQKAALMINEEAANTSVLSKDLIAQWSQFTAKHLLWLPINYSIGELAGGVALLREKPWQEAELRVLEHWHESASHALSAIASQPRLLWYQKLSRIKRRVILGLGCLVFLLMMMPVKLSVLAPAEVAPVNPQVVRSPMNGTIEQVLVKPNQLIEEGDLLIQLDTSSLKTRLQIAQQSLAIAEAEYHQAQQASFRDIDAKSTLTLLNLKIEKQKAEVVYVKSLIDRSHITADSDGIAIFSEANKLIGKTVNLGERVMTVANPDQAELEIWLPVGDDIELQQGSDVRLFLTVSPEKYVPAKLGTIGFQAQEQSGSLAYRLRAAFDDNIPLPRIGQRGIARLEGQRVSLFYYLFRRPAAYLRQTLGL